MASIAFMIQDVSLDDRHLSFLQVAATWAMVSDEEFSDALDLKDVVMSEQMHRKALILNSLKTISSLSVDT